MKNKILAAISSSYGMIFNKPPAVALAAAGSVPIVLDVLDDFDSFALAETGLGTVKSSVIAKSIGISSIAPTALNDYNMCMKERFTEEISWN